LLIQDHRTSTNKSTTIEAGNRAKVTYKKPQQQKDFDTAQACVKRGLEEIENAIKLDPNNESAWSYKTNLLIEASKLAEMDGKMDQKAQLDKQREEAQKRTSALSEANQKKKEEEEAKKAAASPAKSKLVRFILPLLIVVMLDFRVGHHLFVILDIIGSCFSPIRVSDCI